MPQYSGQDILLRVHTIPGRNLYFYEQPHLLGLTALILLIVTIGLLNICLGFGLAMYYDYGPPGLDGIFEALGPMPPAAPSVESLIPAGLGAPYDPSVAPAAPESIAEPSANPPVDNTADLPAESPPSDALAEEEVLGAVRNLAATAQTAMVSGQLESRE